MLKYNDSPDSSGKNLKKFKNTQLTTKEAQHIKGGVRLNEEQCDALGFDWFWDDVRCIYDPSC